jgi:HupE / UreJ protein
MREVLLAAFLVLHASPLYAHPINVGYAEITVRAKEVQISLSLNLFDLDLLLSLDRNLDVLVDDEELNAGRAEVLHYLRQRISVSASAQEVPMEAGPFRIGRGSDGKALFETTLLFRSPNPLEAFAIRLEPLTELGADHKTLAKITYGGSVEQFVFQKGAVYEGRPRSFWAYALQFLGLGMHHIFIGYDHIAFLLGLLLMGGKLLNIIKIVTAFTLAHSVTLFLAALDIVNLPSRLIESGIAFSVAYVAAENLFFKAFDRRCLVSFFFGFVHGFGFANVLKEMHLSKSGLVSSLFFFNFGVEVGQIAIVSLFVPLLWMLGRTRAYRMTIKLASVAIFSLGAFWFFQRVF